MSLRNRTIYVTSSTYYGLEQMAMVQNLTGADVLAESLLREWLKTQPEAEALADAISKAVGEARKAVAERLAHGGFKPRQLATSIADQWNEKK